MKGFIHNFSDASNETLQYFKNNATSQAEGYAMYYCVCEILAECINRSPEKEVFSVFISVVSQKVGISFRKTKKLLESFAEFLENSDKVFQKTGKLSKTFDFQVSYFPEIIELSFAINKRKGLNQLTNQLSNKGTSFHAPDFVPPPGDVAYDALKELYGEKFVLEQYAKQRSFYESNPMKKNFVTFFSEALKRVDSWTDNNHDFDTDDALAEIRKFERENNG